jgi:hypothetical protein
MSKEEFRMSSTDVEKKNKQAIFFKQMRLKEIY